MAWCLGSIAYCFFDGSKSEWLSAKDLIPWFFMVMLMISVLMFCTLVVLKNSESRCALLGLIVLAFITTLPVTSQLMNRISR